MSTFSEYKTALRNPSRQQIYKIEWLDKDENIVNEVVTEFVDGSISIQLQNGVRRSCNITFENADGTFTPDSNGLVYIAKKIKVHSGLVINGSNYFPAESVQGVFNLGNPVLRHDGSSNLVSIEGYDNFSLLNGTLAGTIDSTIYQVNVGTEVNAAIESILTDAGIVQTPIIYSNTEELYYTIIKEAGNTYSDALIELADMIAWDIYFDTHGRPNFRTPIDEYNAAPVWEFRTNEVSYLGCEHNYNYADVRNHIIIYGENINGDLASAEAEDTNIFSPTSISRIGRRTRSINDNLIISDTLAQNRADYELKQSIQRYEFINLQTYNVDFIKEGDIILIDDADGDLNAVRYLVKQINRSLSAGGQMTIQAWKVRETS